MECIHPIILPNQHPRVGIVQTSESDCLFPVRYERAIRQLQQAFGAEVQDYTEYSSPLSTVEAAKGLAERFHRAVEENHLILSLTGGYTTNCMLPYVDYELICSKRRILIGYSDTTALLMAVCSKAGLATLYGPALLGSFGEYPKVHASTVYAMKALVSMESQGFCYSKTDVTSDCNYYWDKEDLQSLPYAPNTGWHSNSDRTVKGILWGGNLNTILTIANTQYMPNIENGILLMEDAFTSYYKLKRDVEALRQRGLLDTCRAVIVGKFFQSGSETEKQRMNSYLLDYFQKLDIPALTDVDFGHSYPQLSIPLGVQGQVDFKNKQIVLCESFVQNHG